MKYSKEFQERVKALYPDEPYVHVLLGQGSPKVKNYLGVMTAQELRKAISNAKTLEEVHSLIKREDELEELGNMWIKSIQ